MPYAPSVMRERMSLEAIHPRRDVVPRLRTADGVSGIGLDAAFARTRLAHFHERLSSSP